MVCPRKKVSAYFLLDRSSVPWAQNRKIIILFFLSNCKETTVTKQLIILFKTPLNVPVREKTGLICFSSIRRMVEMLRLHLARDGSH